MTIQEALNEVKDITRTIHARVEAVRSDGEKVLQEVIAANAKADARVDELAQKVIVTKWTAVGFAVWTLAAIAFGAWLF